METAYAPFDGTSLLGAQTPIGGAPPSLTGKRATLFAPPFYPDQAFFFANAIKSLYLSFTCMFEMVSDGVIYDTPTISTINQIKRFTVPGNTPGRVLFKAQGGSLSVNNFSIDFSKG